MSLRGPARSAERRKSSFTILPSIRTVRTFEVSAAQTTAPTGSMTGATFTAEPSMITMSAFLPGVIDPARSAMPATFAPPRVAIARTWRDVMSLLSGSFHSRFWSQATSKRRARSDAKIARICVNWSDGAVVATSDERPIGTP